MVAEMKDYFFQYDVLLIRLPRQHHFAAAISNPCWHGFVLFKESILFYHNKTYFMSVDLLLKVQENLGYPSLQKIDPNVHAAAEAGAPAEPHHFAQAAIPATLTALYKYVQQDNGAEEVLRGDSSTNWVDKIFQDNHEEVLKAISGYSNQPVTGEQVKLNEIAQEAVKITKEALPADAGIKEVKLFYTDQRNNILLYLPASLHLGGLLHDDTLDDSINKMEGPVSSLMHTIGSVFSNPVVEEEVNKK